MKPQFSGAIPSLVLHLLSGPALSCTCTICNFYWYNLEFVLVQLIGLLGKN